TSTCDMMVVPEKELGDKLVRGICGQVKGSVIPGMIGLEAGQSAFGDTYAWFKNVLMWPLKTLLGSSSMITREIAGKLEAEIAERIIPELSRAAAHLPVNENDEIAVDWLNGRRTPDADQTLTGALSGLSLGSDAPTLY